MRQNPSYGRVELAEGLETRDELREAVELFLRTDVERLFVATDPFERLQGIVSVSQLETLESGGDFDDLFLFGDEAFEAERDRLSGYGQGQQSPTPRPATIQRVHLGERGGVDSGSCRSCHFSGGPDGAGSGTQAAFFRGDGASISSAVRRDAPHVMGLGYISIIAREMTERLQLLLRFARQDARDLQQAVETRLDAKGVEFGSITAYPDGSVDWTNLKGVSQDLIVRPFGHKGRHDQLVALVDEALQVHHGHQTTSRISEFESEADTYLGPGPPNDPDDDGVIEEAFDGQAVLLGSYLSLLGTPRFTVPDDSHLALTAARGARLFEEVGCADCHTPSLGFHSYHVNLRGRGALDVDVTIDLEEYGLEPKPRSVDFGPHDGDGDGVPVFAFTDLRRHDMGPDLADVHDERLPGTEFSVLGSMWLTRSLWGVADTAPYLHDGRALTIDDAIRLHGGEGEAAATQYIDLTESDRGALRAFLATLTRDGVLLVE